MRFILKNGSFYCGILLAEDVDAGLAVRLFKGAHKVKDNYSTNEKHRRYEIEEESSFTLEMIPDVDIQYPSPPSVDLVKNLFLVEQTRAELKRLLEAQAPPTQEEKEVLSLDTTKDMPF